MHMAKGNIRLLILQIDSKVLFSLQLHSLQLHDPRLTSKTKSLTRQTGIPMCASATGVLKMSRCLFGGYRQVLTRETVFPLESYGRGS